jgi:hypothetical protein
MLWRVVFQDCPDWSNSLEVVLLHSFPPILAQSILPQVMALVAVSFKTAASTTSQVTFFPKTVQSCSKFPEIWTQCRQNDKFLMRQKFIIPWDGLLGTTPH